VTSYAYRYLFIQLYTKFERLFVALHATKISCICFNYCCIADLSRLMLTLLIVTHEQECQFNPTKITCPFGCNLKITTDQLPVRFAMIFLCISYKWL